MTPSGTAMSEAEEQRQNTSWMVVPQPFEVQPVVVEDGVKSMTCQARLTPAL
jgi:hypothetical protein